MGENETVYSIPMWEKKKKKSSNIIFILIRSRKPDTFLSPPVILTGNWGTEFITAYWSAERRGRIHRSAPAKPRAVPSCASLNKASNTTRFPPGPSPDKTFVYGTQGKSHSHLRADSRQSSKTAFSRTLRGYPTKSLSTTSKLMVTYRNNPSVCCWCPMW